MKFKLDRVGNLWRLTIICGNETYEFMSEFNLFEREDITSLVINLSKFDGITTEVDFTKRN